MPCQLSLQMVKCLKYMDFVEFIPYKRSRRRGPLSVAARHSATKLGRLTVLLTCFLGVLAGCRSESEQADWISLEREIYINFNDVQPQKVTDGLYSEEASRRWEQAAVFRHLRGKGVFGNASKQWRHVEGAVFGSGPAPEERAAYGHLRAEQPFGGEVPAELAVTGLRTFVLEFVTLLQSDTEVTLRKANRFYSMLEGLDMLLRGYRPTEQGETRYFRTPVPLDTPGGQAMQDGLKLVLSASGLLIDACSGADYVSVGSARRTLKESLLVLNEALAAAL